MELFKTEKLWCSFWTCMLALLREFRSAQDYGNIIAAYRCEWRKENGFACTLPAEVMFVIKRLSFRSGLEPSRHVSCEKEELRLPLTDKWGSESDIGDGRGHPDWSQGPPLNMLHFSAHFCAWKWKRERNMCLDAGICVRAYRSRHFYEPAGCRGPKPQALPTPLLCNSLP